MLNDSLTIILMRDVGKIRSLEIKTERLFYIMILLVILILASLYFTCGYFFLARERGQLISDYQKLELEFKDLDKKVENSEEYKIWSGKVLSSLLNSVEITKPKKNSRPGAVSIEASEESPLVNILSSEVSIGNFQAKTEESNSFMEISLNIINNYEDHRPISGYIIMMAERNENDNPVYASFPAVDIKDGIPANFKKGQFFTIKYLKSVKGYIIKPQEEWQPEKITVFIYSDKGNILYEEPFELNS